MVTQLILCVLGGNYLSREAKIVNNSLEQVEAVLAKSLNGRTDT